ncbi:MAG TPA: matrixin family metalloprotease [Candidatus Entotheonella sp.]
MRNLGIAVFLGVGVVFAVMAWQKSPTACERTLYYRIGIVDPRFGISTRAFKEAIQNAAQLWETPAQHNLFEARADAEFTINLVFDERQKATIAGKTLSRELEQTEASHDNVNEMHQRWQDIYQERSEAYERDLATYRDRLEAHNAAVLHWNQQGDAPRSAYDDLAAERAGLDRTKAALESQRLDLQEIINTLQSLEEKSRTLVANYNRNTKTYNSLRGVRTPFHKGEYNGRDITIYQFHGADDLTLVLAHELGHALGLNHVTDEKAIMHALMGEQDPANPALTRADLNALNAVCTPSS